MQKLVTMQASVRNHFNHERHLTKRKTFKLQRDAVLAEWQQLDPA